MRIIRGTHGGRVILAPGKLPVRPTTDYAKEALFNILENRIDFENTKALDLFSGTGNLSYELASRGCKQITSVETNFGCYDFIRKKAKELEFDMIRPVKYDAFSFIKKSGDEYDLILADPPYELPEIETIPVLVFQHNLLRGKGLLIVEHSRQIDFSKTEHFLESRRYGKVNFSIFGKAE